MDTQGISTGQINNEPEQDGEAHRLLKLLYDAAAYCARPDTKYTSCLKKLLDTAIEVTGATKGNIQLLSRKSDTLKIVVHHGFDEPFLSFFSHVGHGTAAACAAAAISRQRTVVEDVEQSHIFKGKPSLDVLRNAGVRAVQSTPLISSNGHLLGMISTHFAEAHRPDDRQLRAMDLLALQAADFVQRKIAEAAVRESEHRYRDLFEQVLDGIFVIDVLGHCLDANASGLQMLGFSIDELRKLTGADLIEGDDASRADKEFSKLHIGDQFNVELKFRRKDGSVFPGEVIGRRLSGDRYMVIVRDVTGRKKAQQSLMQAQAALSQAQRIEALGQLTGSIAHDFNNLLTVIASNLELAEVSAVNPTARLRIHAAIQAVQAGASFNERLLSFARSRRLAPVAVSINDRVRDMGQLLTVTLGEKAKLVTHCDPRLWKTIADPGSIDSAIINLAVNARDAMAGGGVLSISTRNLFLDDDEAREKGVAQGDYVCLTLSDTGRGMTEEVLSRAFEPLFTTKEAGTGTGLGLPSVYSFAQQSGGFVDISSKVGQGTTVSLCLPRAANTWQTEVSGRENAIPLGNGELILVVEDNDKVREVTIALLESLGYQVVEASSGPRAIEVLEDNHGIRLVLSDVVMPGGMSGYDVEAWVHTHKPGTGLVLASGYNSGVDDQANISHSKVLSKPYTRATLAIAIHQALSLL